MNIGEIIKGVGLVLSVTKQLIDFIDDMIPLAKKGQEKIKIFLDILEQILKDCGDFADDTIIKLKKFADNLVSIYISVKKKIDGEK